MHRAGHHDDFSDADTSTEGEELAEGDVFGLVARVHKNVAVIFPIGAGIISRAPFHQWLIRGPTQSFGYLNALNY